MENKTVFLLLVFGSLLITSASCSNGKEKSSSDGIAMDSASMAERSKDELTLSTLKDKKVAAEQNAKKAMADTKEAKRIERNAIDAAEQADDVFKTEEDAQESRQEADDQAQKADKASNKADEN